MKNLFILMLLSSIALAQTTNSEEAITRNGVEKAVETAQDQASTAEEKKFLSKFKSWTKGVAEKDFVKKTGRGLGKGSSFVTTETLRPFVATGSFFRGLFSKDDKSGTRLRALAYSFYLENEKDLNELYKNPEKYTNHLKNKEAPESIMKSYKDMVVDMFKGKVLNVVKGILKDVNFNPEMNFKGANKKLSDASSLEELAEMIQDLKVEDNPMLLLSLEVDKLNNETVKKHLTCNNMGTIAPHIDILPLITSLTNAVASGKGVDEDSYKKAISEELLADIDDFINQFIEFDEGVWKNKEIMGELGESVAGIAGKFIVPAAVLGGIASGAGAVYLGVTGAALIGSSISVATCTKNKNQKKLMEDPDFRQFCSYVVMRNSQKILKSKAKGFMAGKGLRNSIKMIKYRRDFIKSCKSTGISGKSCRDQYKDEKADYLISCRDSGYTKRECRRMRNSELLNGSKLLSSN